MIEKLITEMITYFDGDIKRINHALKVHSFSKFIGENEKLNYDDRIILEIAAILHDIGIKNSEIKYNSSNGKWQQIEGPPVAKEILQKYNVMDKVVERVCYLIAHHHDYSNIQGQDYQILIEADFLVNIYEDEFDKGSIKTVYDKYFKTETGRMYIENIYKVY
ncbi:HD domain-containing protein [Clostridium grantii]|uniref:HD domain-containing protein n=1 Tax=Clostridium grantii DSM 8605 TaxID=1121316 RepID=A0A1M5UXW5_9CLOT|nr:HD domain-containing protein [Clostridium grantii]SHH67780.1 HD domain-containing protein [Clostridium grantii DSM 8605]